jgi:hypothetical protein
MCPCLSTLRRIVAGSESTGGLAALAVKIPRKQNNTSGVTADLNERSISDVNPHD